MPGCGSWKQAITDAEGDLMSYLMENSNEDRRLGIKTDPAVVRRQAAWAGIGPGMRVLDVGCGSGFTTAALAELVGEKGHVTGLDSSEERLAIARERFGSDRVSFVCHDIRTPFHSSSPYDAVWARFILEYFRQEQCAIVANSVASLRVGGIACLADSDNNSLGHYGHSERLQNTLVDIMTRLERNFNFDPYAGRRLYDHLFSLKFKNIDCMVEPHHLIYGELSEKDAYNWVRKLELTAQKSGCRFDEYAGEEFTHYPSRYEAFLTEFKEYFSNPRRFSYTPLVLCRGEKALQVVE
jgi:ubiquinone/menaquinone biosynthesis C-methylase UbiE